MTRYAERTEVTADKSRAEIEATLRRYGATAFGYGWEREAAVVVFQIAGRRIRFNIQMPDPKAREFTHTPARDTPRSPSARAAEYERAVRQRYRALALVIKAKLEAVAVGITSVEEEFLAHIVLPNGSTVGEWASPQIALAYEREQMPALLPGGGS
jgi:hypothetical protein